jgi:hypothetical protein
MSKAGPLNSVWDCEGSLDAKLAEDGRIMINSWDCMESSLYHRRTSGVRKNKIKGRVQDLFCHRTNLTCQKKEHQHVHVPESMPSLTLLEISLIQFDDSLERNITMGALD